MAESTSNYSMYDLVLRVAVAAGVAYYGNAGDERASIPIDAHDLDKCRQTVNDAIKTFISDAPPTGWRWMNRIMEVTLATVQTEGTADSGTAVTLKDTALQAIYTTDASLPAGYYIYDQTKEIYGVVESYVAGTDAAPDGTVTVEDWLDYDDNPSALTPAAGDSYSITNLQTVDGDKARYPLPQDFMGEVSGKITYAKGSGRGHIIDWDSEGAVRFQREVTVTTGHPNRAAVRPWRNRRWELIVNPSPTAGDTLIFPYKVGFDKLQIEAGDASAAGADSLTDATLANLYPDDYFNGWTITIMSGTGRSSYAEVENYTGNSGKFDIVDDDWLKSNGLAGGVDPAANSGFYVEPENNKHPAGMQFDSAILSACLMQAELDFESLQLDYSPSEKYMKKDLPAAYRTDARSAPKKLGIMQPGTRRVVHRRTWKNVEYE